MDLNTLNGLINMVEKKIKKLTAKIPKIKSKKSKKNKYKFIGGIRFADPKKYEIVLKALLYLLDREYLERNNLIPFFYSTDPQHIILIDDIIKRNGRATEAYSMPAYDIILIKSDSPHTGTIRRKIYNFFTDQFIGDVKQFKSFIKDGLTAEEKSDIILVDAKSRGELTDMDDGPSDTMGEITTESEVPYFVVSFRTIHNDTESKENTEETIKKMLMNPVESFKEVIFTSPTQRIIVKGEALQGIFRDGVSSGVISSIAERAEEEMKVAGETGQKGFKQRTAEEAKAEAERQATEAEQAGTTVASEAVARSKEQALINSLADLERRKKSLQDRMGAVRKKATKLTGQETPESRANRERKAKEEETKAEAKRADNNAIKLKLNKLKTLIFTDIPKLLKEVIYKGKIIDDRNKIKDNIDVINSMYNELLTNKDYFFTIQGKSIPADTKKEYIKVLFDVKINDRDKQVPTMTEKTPLKSIITEYTNIFAELKNKYDEIIEIEQEEKKEAEKNRLEAEAIEKERKEIIEEQRKLREAEEAKQKADQEAKEARRIDIQQQVLKRKYDFFYKLPKEKRNQILKASTFIEKYGSSIYEGLYSLKISFIQNINRFKDNIKNGLQYASAPIKSILSFLYPLMNKLIGSGAINKSLLNIIIKEIDKLSDKDSDIYKHIDTILTIIFIYMTDRELFMDAGLVYTLETSYKAIIKYIITIFTPFISFLLLFREIFMELEIDESIREEIDESIQQLLITLVKDFTGYLVEMFKILLIPDEKFLKYTNIFNKISVGIPTGISEYIVERFNDKERIDIDIIEAFDGYLTSRFESEEYMQDLDNTIALFLNDGIYMKITDDEEVKPISPLTITLNPQNYYVVVDLLSDKLSPENRSAVRKMLFKLSELTSPSVLKKFRDEPQPRYTLSDSSSSSSSSRPPRPPPVATSTTAPPTRRKMPPVSVRSDDSIPYVESFERQQQQQQQQQPLPAGSFGVEYLDQQPFIRRRQPAYEGIAYDPTREEDMDVEIEQGIEGQRQSGTGKGLWELHKVYISKPISLEKAKKIAKKFIKGNKTFYKEYPEKYNFRNIPKQKFNMFRGKKLNDEITLIYGRLKPENSNLKRKKGGIKIEDLDGFESNSDCD